MNWNLEDIFKNKEEFENTKKELLENLDKIESFQGKLCDTSDNLYNFYKLDEKALEQFEKIYSYGMLKYHLDMSNGEGIKIFKEVEGLATIFDTKTSYITPEITYADETKIRKYLEEERFEGYKRDIEDILAEKEHTLSKEEENLLANYSEIFSAPENTFDILTNAEFKFGTLINENGEEVELTDSNYTIYMKNKNEKVRKQAFDLMYKKYSEYINTITEMYLTNVKQNEITSKLRKYNSGLEMAVEQDDAKVTVYNSLIKAIDENISANHEFLRLKSKLLNKEKVHIYDIYVKTFEKEEDKISYKKAKKDVLDSLSVLGDEYVGLLNKAFNENWIDLESKPNKKGGAYSTGVFGVHPYVLTNFEYSKRDVSTIAHELGHAIHSYYSNKNQNVLNADYTIMVAEVASTVNELLLSKYQLDKETDKTKKAEILYELLEMIRATFFRQSMFAEFEKQIHEKIKEGIQLSSDDLNNVYYKLNEKYFGKEIILDEEIKYEWARIPHFYSNFYVYKYATGISCAIKIANNILKQGKPYVEKYLNMLKQGCSKKSIELLKMADVDLESEDTYLETIKFYKEKTEELKSLL